MSKNTASDQVPSPKPFTPSPSAAPTQAAKSGRWVKPTIALGGILAVLGVGVTMGPEWARPQIEQAISDKIGRQVTLGAIQVKPLSLSAQIGPIAVRNADGSTLLAAQGLTATLGSGIFAGMPHLAKVDLVKPQVHVKRLGADQFDVSDILERLNQQPKSDEPPRFRLDHLTIQQGLATLDDQTVKVQHTLKNLDLDLSDLRADSEPAKKPARLAVSAVFNDASLQALADIGLFTATPHLVVSPTLEKLDLGHYLPYAEALKLPIDLIKGVLSVKSKVHIAMPAAGAAKAAATPPAIHVDQTEVLLEHLAVVDARKQPILNLERLHLDGASVDVANQTVTLAKLAVVQPALDLGLDAQGGLAKPMLAPAPAAPTAAAAQSAESAATPSTSKTAARPWTVKLAEATLREGSAKIDVPMLKRGAPVPIELIDISAKDIQLVAGGSEPAQLSLQASLKALFDGAKLDVDSQLADQKVHLTTSLQGLMLPKYAAMLPPAPVLKNGTANADAKIDLDLASGGVLIDALNLGVNGLMLAHPKTQQPVVELNKLTVGGVNLDLAKKWVKVDQVKLDGGALALKRLKNGDLELAQWAAAASGHPTAAANPTASSPKPKADPASGSAWQARIAKLNLNQLDVDFRDDAESLKLPKTTLNVAAQDLSQDLRKPIKFDLNATMADKGVLGLAGQATPQPLAASTQFKVNNLALQHVQPYLDKYLNLALETGRLWSEGQINLASDKTGSLDQVGFKGFVSIHDFRALDRVNASDFVRWNALTVPMINAKLPLSRMKDGVIETSDIALVDFYARVILNADGRINLADILIDPTQAKPTSITSATAADGAAPAASDKTEQAKAEEKPEAQSAPKSEAQSEAKSEAKPEAKAAEQPTIRLGNVRIARGNVNFTDNFIKPNYTVNLTQLEGSVSPIASDKPETADVLIRGKIDDDAPVEIVGNVHPLQPVAKVNLRGTARGIEMSGLSPYSSKYTGYPIERGKLSAEVRYLIDDGKLDADNRIVLDQLTFGNKVEDPNVKTLPVQLAVALLKDSRGVIDINLPISGSLNDPQFSIGALIGKVVVNLITKAITAPFRLLASLGGGGDAELSMVDFPAGLATLDGESRKRLDQLGKALTDRPGLSLDITGHADPDSDRSGLKRAKIDDAVRNEKIRKIKAEDSRAAIVEPLDISDTERDEFIGKLYSQAKFDKPRNVIGFARSLPVPEMQRLLIDNTQVTDNDLRELAQHRAAAAREYLRDVMKIDPNRMFVLAPKLGSAADGDKTTAPTGPLPAAGSANAEAAGNKPNSPRRTEFAIRQ